MSWWRLIAVVLLAGGLALAAGSGSESTSDSARVVDGDTLRTYDGNDRSRCHPQ